MATYEIPSKKYTTCDCCERECGKDGCWRQQNGGLLIKRDLLDFQGSPCASGNVSIDLCDSCLEKISNVVNKTCADIRAYDAARRENKL